MPVDKPNDEALAPVPSGEPWLRNKHWADGRIRSSRTFLGLLFFTFVWNLISFPVWWLLRGADLRTSDWGTRLAMIFPAIGVVLIVCTVVSILRWLKFGRSVLELASMPGVIGGQLAGVIHTRVKIEPEDAFRIRLTCVNCVTTTGSKRQTSRGILWQDELVVTQDLLAGDGSQSAIPVLFQIPYECRASDDSNSNNVTLWNLEITAPTRGLNYAAEFNVPVFKTAESDPDFVIDRELLAKYSAPENADRDLREAGITRMPAPDGDGWRWIFPMARYPGTAFMFTLAGLACLVGPVVWMVLDFGVAAVAFGLICGLIGLVVLFIALDMWFYRSVVDASRRGLTVTGGLFGRGPSQKIEAAEIERFETVSNMKTEKLLYYDLIVVCTDGKKVTAGKRLAGQRLANSIIRQIGQALGRQDTPASGRDRSV